MKIDQNRAVRFAREWIEAWNRRDVASVLVHYTDDFEMSSPFIEKVTGESSGTLTGKQKVEAYWRAALERLPNLHFEIIKVLAGVESVVVYYRTGFGKLAAETFFFNSEGRVWRAVAHYADEENPDQETKAG